LKTIYFFKSLYIALLVFCVSNSLCQNRNNVWCFGDSAGIDFNSLNNPIPIVTSLDTRGSCASICDTSGSLLFYVQTKPTFNCYGGEVFNKLGLIMQNGDSLRGESWYHELIIIPWPGNDNLFYLFYVGSACGGNDFGFFYSIIDISQNAGIGNVIQKNIRVNNFTAVDALSAIKHANGRDWWVIIETWNNPNNNFYKFLITPLGIVNYGFQSIGGLNSTNEAQMTFSNGGTKVLFTSLRGLLEIMEFDRCSGNFSNANVIEQEALVAPFKRYFSNAFSGDASKIYVSTNDDTSFVFQYDINAPDILASKDTIYGFSNVIGEGGNLQLAPNNKIYLSNAWNDGIHNNYPYQSDSASFNFINMNLSVINSPDSLGSACDFQPYSFYLGGKRTYWGLPNNPNYHLGPVIGSQCDTLFTSVGHGFADEYNLHIFPNPFTTKINLYFSNPQNAKAELQILNIIGDKMLEMPILIQDQSVDLTALKEGIYFVKITTSNFIYIAGIVK
jgi:hypothetical protein